jgi:hypothetical protein
MVKHEKDGPKVNVFCFQRRDKVYRPFFFDTEAVAEHLLVFGQWTIQTEGSSHLYIFFCGKPSVRCHFYQMKNLCISHQTSEAWCLPWGLYMDIRWWWWFQLYTSVDRQLATQGIFRSGEEEDRCDLEPVTSFAHKTVKSFLCRYEGCFFFNLRWAIKKRQIDIT